LAPPLRLGL
jgi:hypothetical protein